MPAETTLKRHASLVDRMAGAVGLDLEEKMLEGTLSFDALSDAVLRCSGCSDPEQCARWLDAQTAETGAARAGCRNATLFTALKNGKRM